MYLHTISLVWETKLWCTKRFLRNLKIKIKKHKIINFQYTETGQVSLWESRTTNWYFLFLFLLFFFLLFNKSLSRPLTFITKVNTNQHMQSFHSTHLDFCDVLFNQTFNNSLHARLTSDYEALSYKTKKHMKFKAYRKSV